ncbi:prepilin peptidase [Pseudonocardia oroxyli]|uniref:prepilin peptidase n=1 Tax=Pseudonocardia oroxyli TaxID=366584 RepID=UPI0015A1B9F4|nr:prepilin peptidase [Pseudonocardia oroxyli]
MESVAGALVAGVGIVAAEVGGSATSLALLASVAVFGGAAMIVDVTELRLPNRLVAAQSVAVVLAVSVTGGADPNALIRAAVAAAAMGMVATGLLFVVPTAFGWGDVKILPSLAAATAFLGWRCTALTVGLSGLLLLVSAVTAALNRPGGDVPYGPALVLGTLAGVALTL